MKKLITLLLLSPTLFFAQEKETVVIYETKNGVKEIFPSKIVEISPKENKT